MIAVATSGYGGAFFKKHRRIGPSVVFVLRCAEPVDKIFKPRWIENDDIGQKDGCYRKEKDHQVEQQHQGGEKDAGCQAQGALR